MRPFTGESNFQLLPSPLMKRKQVTASLNDAEEAKLNAIAKRHRCVSRHGASAGHPSWRALLHDIAMGYLVVVRPGGDPPAKAKPPAEKQDREFAFHESSPPKWWDSAEGRMNIDQLVKKTGTPREKLIEIGFRIGGSTVRPPANWLKWADCPAPTWWVDSDDQAGMTLEDAKRLSGLDEDSLESIGMTVAGDEVVI